MIIFECLIEDANAICNAAIGAGNIVFVYGLNAFFHRMASGLHGLVTASGW
jgi:hypothetical protein